MQLRTLGTFAASFGLWLGSTPAAEPGLLSIFQRTETAKPADDKSADKKLADAVAAKVKASDLMSNADLEFTASNGAVSVKGSVATEMQKKAVLETARYVDGVKMVKDGLQVKATKTAPQFVVQAQATSPTVVPPALPSMPTEPARMPLPETVTKPVDNKAANQKLADAVAAKLQGSDAASNAEIEFHATAGEVSVSGSVGSESKKKAILDIVRRVDGVKMVKDSIQVKAAVKPVAVATEQARVPHAEPVVKAQSMATVDHKADNQKLADTIFTKLRGSGAAVNADLDIFANNGAVVVAGTVGSEMQKQAIIDTVRRVEGVTIVRDGVQVKAMAPRAVPQMVMPVQAVGPLATMAPSAMPPMPMGNPQIAEAYPVGPGGGLDGAAPPLPQNAWPTYAPYNNVSRVAYPTAYPYNAFPFIGPYYPFPKVPLGWRKVTLEWEDGHWWLGRKQAPIDYWRVKFGY